MKVLNLCCAAEHRFEGWFASEADYLSQAERGLVACPMCGDQTVHRMPSAPHVWSASSRALSAPQEARERAAHASAAAAATAAGAAPTAARAVVSVAGPERAASAGADQHTVQSAWLRAVQHLIKNTDDVGTQFAEEARRIHYGEADDRAIRGTATNDEAAALHDEGIEVHVIPMPAALKGSVQ
jgi:hypothetical protein